MRLNRTVTVAVNLFLLVLFSILPSEIGALRFFLPPHGVKCLKEEIHKGVVVTGEYEMSDAPGQSASLHVRVKDTRSHVLYQRVEFKENNGKFAFTTDDYDIFDICITSHVPQQGRFPSREVSLDIRHGVEAKNYDDLAKAEKLKPLEVELRRLEDLSESIVQDFSYMRQREEQMRNTNESTNSLVLYLSVLSMLCLLGLATWQVLYLRRYFKAKKLID